VFLRDRKTQDAVIRNLEVVGEAVKNLSQQFRDQHPQVPWKRVAGMRDLLIHRYFGVKLETVWEVVTTELPGLRAAIEAMLAD
jgi:uncharacterized protein with HEPN domain